MGESTSNLPGLRTMEAHALVGKRVRISAARTLGTARLLNGLTGIVISTHPIAQNWFKLLLDPNDVTPHAVWSIARDRLIEIE